MHTYMTQFSYTDAAAAAFVKNPEDRSGVFREQVEELGGRVIAFYHCIGEYDGVTIYGLPDEAAVSGLLFAIRAPGHLEKIHPSELHPVETATEGMGRDGKGSYRGPWTWWSDSRAPLWAGV